MAWLAFGGLLAVSVASAQTTATAPSLPATPPAASPAEQPALAVPALPVESTIRALLVPQNQSVLSSQMAGRITAIPVGHGDSFKRGQTLVRFDCALTHAEHLKARAEVTAAQKTHESNLQLKEHNAVSNLEIDLSKARLDKAYADLARTQAMMGMCEIRAPFNGRVVKIRANPYENVTLGQPLMEVLDDSKLKMQVYVPSAWLKWLKPGTGFEVKIDETGGRYPAKVTAIGARVDAVSQTLEIEAEVTGRHNELLAGMSGVAEFPVPK